MTVEEVKKSAEKINESVGESMSGERNNESGDKKEVER